VTLTKEPDNVFVHIMNLPDGTNEMVSPNEDGTYSIFLNAKLSNEGQFKAYRHAMQHIARDDFDSYADVQAIEAEVRREAQALTTPPVLAKYIKRLERIQRRRRKIQRELRERTKALEELDQIIEIEFFALAEYQKLYGNDL